MPKKKKKCSRESTLEKNRTRGKEIAVCVSCSPREEMRMPAVSLWQRTGEKWTKVKKHAGGRISWARKLDMEGEGLKDEIK